MNCCLLHVVTLEQSNQNSEPVSLAPVLLGSRTINGRPATLSRSGSSETASVGNRERRRLSTSHVGRHQDASRYRRYMDTVLQRRT